MCSQDRTEILRYGKKLQLNYNSKSKTIVNVKTTYDYSKYFN
jgi:hypothetical protein